MDNKDNKPKDSNANNGMYYTGIFANEHGKPEFYGIGNILRFAFIIYALYIITINKYKYSTIAILCLIAGNIMTTLKYYQMNENLDVGNDYTHFMHKVLSHSFVLVLGVIALLVIYLKK